MSDFRNVLACFLELDSAVVVIEQLLTHIDTLESDNNILRNVVSDTTAGWASSISHHLDLADTNDSLMAELDSAKAEIDRLSLELSKSKHPANGTAKMRAEITTLRASLEQANKLLAAREDTLAKLVKNMRPSTKNVDHGTD